MANTTAVDGRVITITPDANTDWNLATDMPGFVNTGLQLKSIMFTPSAANDVIVIRNVDVTGAELLRATCSGTTDVKFRPFAGDRGQRCYPYIDKTDCTLGTPANVRITLEIA